MAQETAPIETWGLNGRSGREDSMMSQGGTLSDIHLPVRWVVLFTGSKATEDYQPAASAAESPALVREVTDMCVAFHPHTDIRLFPQEGESLLFWKARTTGDWVITRVAVAPNPQGLRTALEYCSVVLSDADFVKLRRNPFRTRDLHLHEKVRQEFLDKHMEPFDFDLANDTVVLSSPNRNSGNGTSTPSDSGPALSADRLSTPENVTALHTYAQTMEEVKGTIPTFASWWSSSGEVPAGYFDIVLRAQAPKALSLREALEAVTTTATDTKEHLPNSVSMDSVANDLMRGILGKADTIVNQLSGVATHINTLTVEEFQANLAEAATLSNQVAGDLRTLRKRMENTVTDSEGARLNNLAVRYELLFRELPKVRHPNPFTTVVVRPDASKKNTTTGNIPRPTNGAATTTTTLKSNGRQGGGINPIAIGIGVLAVGGAVTAAVLMSKPKDTPKQPTPKPAASSSAPAPTGQNGKAASDPTKDLLSKKQNAILSGAKTQAEKDAKTSALKSGNLDESQLDGITLQAIRDGYEKELSDAEFQKVFSGAKAWNYAKFKQALPTLTLDVRGSAIAGNAAGTTERNSQQKIDAAERERAAAEKRAQEAANRPTPEPTPRPQRRRPSSEEDRPKPPRRNNDEENRPKPANPPEGDARNTGL